MGEVGTVLQNSCPLSHLMHRTVAVGIGSSYYNAHFTDGAHGGTLCPYAASGDVVAQGLILGLLGSGSSALPLPQMGRKYQDWKLDSQAVIPTPGKEGLFCIRLVSLSLTDYPRGLDLGTRILW